MSVALGAYQRAAGVTLSRKGAKNRTGGRKLRSSGTKARRRAVSTSQPQPALVNKLKARARDLENKLSEALDQQSAASEVLKVISSSPGELEPVFKAMLENATKLCGASYGTMWLTEGEGFRAAARHGTLPVVS